jgi:uncharacterized protein YdhG (YjbR/CyaY superfamily)
MRLLGVLALMAERKTARKRAASLDRGFSSEERAAMKERVREMRARARSGKVDGETEVLEKIATMDPSDRAMAERFHAIVKATAPNLVPRTWYGMPAYTRDGRVVCFFRDAQKFKTRYATLGFSDEAKLDEGRMWPTDFALSALGDAEEARIAALLRKALG